MTGFLFVHGSCHGAWCWRDLIPQMERLGHTCQAIDLPANGADDTPMEDVTLDLYAKAIVRAIDGPVILVAHSAGGYPALAAAQLAPNNIRHLVYISAYVPQTGESMIDRRMEAPRQPLLDAVVKSSDGISYTIDPQKAGEKFYQDCSQEIIDYANTHLSPQPILPQATALTVTNAGKRIPKSYIRCSRDQAVPPEFQITMSEGFDPANVYKMQSSHSPFFSQPAKLALILNEIARKS